MLNLGLQDPNGFIIILYLFFFFAWIFFAAVRWPLSQDLLPLLPRLPPGYHRMASW